MAYVHGKDTRVLIDEFNRSAFFSSADLAHTVETADVTTFGDAAHEYIPGLRDGTISLAGLFDGAADAVDEELAAILGASGGALVTVTWGTPAVGNRARSCKVHATSYQVTGSVSDAVQVSAEVQADGGIDVGRLLSNLTAVTSAGNGTSVNNSASSANGYGAYLHVLAFTGTDATLKVQHSSDDSTFADLATFTQVTGVTSERLTGTGTVNQYTRYNLAGTFTSITFLLVLARR